MLFNLYPTTELELRQTLTFYFVFCNSHRAFCIIPRRDIIATYLNRLLGIICKQHNPYTRTKRTYQADIITPRFALQTASFINAPHDNSRLSFTVCYTRQRWAATAKNFFILFYSCLRDCGFDHYATGCLYNTRKLKKSAFLQSHASFRGGLLNGSWRRRIFSTRTLSHLARLLLARYCLSTTHHWKHGNINVLFTLEIQR